MSFLDEDDNDFPYTNPYTQTDRRTNNNNENDDNMSDSSTYRSTTATHTRDSAGDANANALANPYRNKSLTSQHHRNRPPPIETGGNATRNKAGLNEQHSSRYTTNDASSRYTTEDATRRENNIPAQVLSPGSSSAKLQSLVEKLTSMSDSGNAKQKDHNFMVRPGSASEMSARRSGRQRILSEMNQLLENGAILPQSSSFWTLQSAMAVVDAVFENCTQDDPSNKNSPQDATNAARAASKVLQEAMTEWWSCDDSLMYAVLIHDCALSPVREKETASRLNASSVLDVLQLMACKNFASYDWQTTAAICLSSAWRSMERIQVGIDSNQRNVYVSGGSVWWLPLLKAQNQWRSLIAWALETWTNPSKRAELCDSAYANTMSTSKENALTAAFVILAQFLKRGCDWWLDELMIAGSREGDNRRRKQPPPESLVAQLLDQADRLADPTMPFSSYAKLAMASLHFLLVLNNKIDMNAILSSPTNQHRLNKIMSDVNMWEHLWNQLCTSNGVFNTKEASTWTIPLLRQRIACEDLSPLLFLSDSSQSRAPIKEMWNQFLQRGGLDMDNSVCARLEGVWSINPNVARNSLNDVLNDPHSSLAAKRKTQKGLHPIETLMKYLFNGILESHRQHTSTESPYQHAVLLLTILKDSLPSHDLSKAIGEEMMKPQVIQALFDAAVHESNQDGDATRHPTTLALLDMLVISLTKRKTKGVCSRLLQSAQRVEALIQEMSPSDARMNTAAMDLDETTLSDVSAESNRSTPTAHNLSRIEADLSVVDFRTETVVRGIAGLLRLTSATTLQLLSNHSEIDELTSDGNVHDCTLVRGRIHDATSHFFSDFLETRDETGPSPIEATLEWAQRRFRFLALFLKDGSTSTLDFVAGISNASELARMNTLYASEERVRKCETDLRESKERERVLASRVEGLKQQLEAKSSRFVREKSLLQHKANLEAKQMTDGIAIQAKKAERKLEEVTKALQKAEKSAEAAKADAMATKKELLQADSTVTSLERQLSDKEAKSNEIATSLANAENEMKTLRSEQQQAREKLKTLQERETTMAKSLQAKNENLHAMEESYEDMQHSLESLFADMVSLAQLYEIKEKEVTSGRKNVENTIASLKRELEAERKRNDKLESRQRQITYENDELSKKYQRVRDVLDEERAERASRREEDKILRKRSQPISYINHLHSTRSGSGKENSFASGSGKENSFASSSHRSRSSKHGRRKGAS